MDIAERLRALSSEISELQTEIAILEEQIAFQTEVADDARIRALVSETPLADRESQVATGDLARLMRVRADTLKKVEQLRADQDGLLERMLEDREKR
ncbi:MAG: hypothetical protein ACXVQY_12385 [Actinomycetota bacterium]